MNVVPFCGFYYWKIGTATSVSIAHNMRTYISLRNRLIHSRIQTRKDDTTSNTKKQKTRLLGYTHLFAFTIFFRKK